VKKYFAISSILILFGFRLGAQDFPYQYFTHISEELNNPSFTAFEHDLLVEVASYNLWAGGFKPVANSFVNFSINARINKYSRRNEAKIGLGASVLREQIGPFLQNALHIKYAYHIPVARHTGLSFGVCGMIENIAVNVSKLNPNYSDDPRILAGNSNAAIFDGGFGVSVHAQKYGLSLSVLNLAPTNFSFKNSSVEQIKNYRKMHLTGQYNFELDRSLLVQPKISLRNNIQQKIKYDTEVNVKYKGFLFGAGYRSEQSVFVFTKMNFENLLFSYTSENPLKSNHLLGRGHTLSVAFKINELTR